MTPEERELAAILDAPKVDADDELQAELDEIFEDGTPLLRSQEDGAAPQPPRYRGARPHGHGGGINR